VVGGLFWSQKTLYPEGLTPLWGLQLKVGVMLTLVLLLAGETKFGGSGTFSGPKTQSIT